VSNSAANVTTFTGCVQEQAAGSICIGAEKSGGEVSVPNLKWNFAMSLLFFEVLVRVLGG
jgi:hypothetical protein